MPTVPVTPSLAVRGQSAAGRGLVRQVVRAVVTLSLWIVLGFAVGLTAWLIVPTHFGHPVLTVLSGSMQPTLGVGSVVIDEKISPVEARSGDILSFPDPRQRDRTLTHRLQSLRVEDGRAFMVTRGDANDAPERWSVPIGDEIGRVVYHVPKVGYVRSFISTRGARLGVLGIVLALGLYLLVDIWRPRRRREPASGVGPVVIDEKVAPVEASEGDTVRLPDPPWRDRTLDADDAPEG